MREDEDQFRYYVPLLRRIIILVAVITAIPVILWTITAFVRTYVAPPKVPTFRPMTATASIAVPPVPDKIGKPPAQGAVAQPPSPMPEGRAAANDAPGAKGPLLADRMADVTGNAGARSSPSSRPRASGRNSAGGGQHDAGCAQCIAARRPGDDRADAAADGRRGRYASRCRPAERPGPASAPPAAQSGRRATERPGAAAAAGRCRRSRFGHERRKPARMDPQHLPTATVATAVRATIAARVGPTSIPAPRRSACAPGGSRPRPAPQKSLPRARRRASRWSCRAWRPWRERRGTAGDDRRRGYWR